MEDQGYECRYFWEESFIDQMVRKITMKMIEAVKEREEWEDKCMRDHLDNINEPKQFNGLLRILNKKQDNGKD